MTERDIFTAARELADPTARAAYLDGVCGGDAVLRARVEALLRAHADPDSLLDESPDAAPTRSFPSDEPDDRADALAFLAPPGRPGSLGRLGHYEVLEVLGRGGFGVVFRAFDETLQRVVAVKMLAPSLAATSPARKRFTREALAAAAVRHENVVQIHETGEQPLPYLVMEFIPGETLQQRLDRTGPLDVSEVLRIGRQVAAGLAAAHAQGLVHRDIKPANILLEGVRGEGQGAREGGLAPLPSPLTPLTVKITDFGLARAADDASLTRSGVVAGTPMYMAPEQARGESLDHRADLFSLGSVLYATSTGRPPFRATTTFAVLKRVAEDDPRPMREVIPEVPEWLCRVVEKLHAKDPGERFQTAAEVADVLADCEAQLADGGAVRDLSRLPAATPPTRGRRRDPAILAVLLFTVFVVLVMSLSCPVGAYWLFKKEPVRGANQSTNHPGPGPEVVETAAPPAATDGWVPLFNGKDTVGWDTPRVIRGGWRAEDGVLVGSGPVLSQLRSVREDFADFHLRAELKVTSPSIVSLLVRNDRSSGTPRGYKLYLAGLGGKNVRPTLTSFPPNNRVIGSAPKPFPLDEWYTLEVIAEGPRIVVRANGEEYVRVTDGTSARGQFGVMIESPTSPVPLASRVEFRKVEIKELPATAATP